MKNLSLLILLFLTVHAYGQRSFTPVHEVSCTEVKSQDRTGTCWSFATSSFFESEVQRLKDMDVNLSEMYVVRQIYKEKARNYVLRQGKAQFSQGSLSHDFINAFSRYGAVPESVYNGLDGKEKHNHSELVSVLKGVVDALVGQRTLSDKWEDNIDAILDVYLGSVPAEFQYNGKTYTPESFGKSLGINQSNYTSFTSFTHQPFYSSFVLEIPDNFSNGSFVNVPLNDLVNIIDYSIKNNYSVAWDGDVSEKGFLRKKGLAVLVDDIPKDIPDDWTFTEEEVTEENRQAAFMNYRTTDDHLMHLVGIYKDQDGNKYYKIKNSWGTKSGEYGGFVFMSENYLRMKTVAIVVNNKAIPKKVKKELKK